MSKPTTARLLALLWLLLCIGLLVFAFVRRETPGMPSTFTGPLIALTFPIGLPVGAIVDQLMSLA